MKKDTYLKMLAILFILIIFGFFILNIFSKDIEFSMLENRSLAKKPKFSIDRLMSNRYTSKYEKYTNDQFYSRNLWMNLKCTVDSLLNKKESNNVFIGKDGYFIEKFLPSNDDRLNTNIEAINNFAKNHTDIKTYFLLAPTAQSIMKDKLPKNAPVISEKQYIDKVNELLINDINFIDVFETLLSHKNEYIYYKTDHHWTTLGAYTAFLKSSQIMDINPPKDYYDILQVSNGFNGTLSAKSGYKTNNLDTIEVYIPKVSDDKVIVNYIEEQKKLPSFYKIDNINNKDKYSIFLDGNHSLVKIDTTAKVDRTLMVIKDSYANAFIPFLSPHFNKIIIIDPRYFYDNIEELLTNEKITDILYLYNVNTFSNDNYLNLVLNNE